MQKKKGLARRPERRIETWSRFDRGSGAEPPHSKIKARLVRVAARWCSRWDPYERSVRVGGAPQGLKPLSSVAFAARLKPCPPGRSGKVDSPRRKRMRAAFESRRAESSQWGFDLLKLLWLRGVRELW